MDGKNYIQIRSIVTNQDSSMTHSLKAFISKTPATYKYITVYIYIIANISGHYIDKIIKVELFGYIIRIRVYLTYHPY